MRWMGTSVLVSLLLACTLLIGCGGTAVPDVVGVDSAAAVKTMRNAGLSPQVRRRPSSIVDKGIVISTDPAQGKVLADGARVSLSVSSGPPFKMTDVVATAEDLPFAASSVSDPVSFSGASMDGERWPTPRTSAQPELSPRC